MNKIWTIIIFCFLLTVANATPFKNVTHPGEFIIKPIPCGAKAYFKRKRLLTTKIKNHCVAIAGIPLDIKTGKSSIIVKNKKHIQFEFFKILDKKYPLEHITIRKKAYKKKPSPEFLKRLKYERKMIKKAASHWDDKMYTSLKFRKPLEGRMSSAFGLRRIYNKKKRRRHWGLDIAAPRGTKVHAPATGYVINTGNYFFTGKTVFISHGQGLITVYAHLSKIIAKKNQKIKKGQVLGLVGSTGRSTGPHLHWGVILNQARINPLLLVNFKT